MGTKVFSTFADVERRYNATKPIKSKAHEGHDLRPIASRSRKWERIVKIDADCYALTEGYHHGDWVLYPHSGASGPADMKLFAPIVWQRFGADVETVTVRNGFGPGMDQRRYKFLTAYLPWGLNFQFNRDGKHYVQLRSTSTQLFLPKATHLTAAALTHQWVPSWATGTEDTTSLTFRKDGPGNWELISKVQHPARTGVNKELKAEYKDDVAAFMEWAILMTPMLGLADWKVRAEYQKQISDYCKEQGVPHHFSRYTVDKARASLFRTILRDREHPMRTALAATLMGSIDAYRAPTSKEEYTRIRSKANSWINKYLGFTQTTTKQED